MHKVRIVLAEDHGVVRAGLRKLIEAEADMEVVGEAADGEQALRLIDELRPDIAILDVSIPKMNAMEVATAARERAPDTRVLALTVHEDTSYLRALLDAGASGYVLKRSAAEELNRAIRNIADGGVYLDPAMAARLLGMRGPAEKGRDRFGIKLTDREAAVLRQVAAGYSNRQVAAALGVSVKTVETHKMRAMDKLDLHSRVDVVRYAVRQGWLEEP